MNWFIAKLIFSIEQEEACASQFDEQIRLVQAGSALEAMKKAETIARVEEQEFVNSNGHRVAWQLAGIPYLNELDELEDGKEICSQIIESDDAESYKEQVNRRYHAIKDQLAHATSVT